VHEKLLVIYRFPTRVKQQEVPTLQKDTEYHGGLHSQWYPHTDQAALTTECVAPLGMWTSVELLTCLISLATFCLSSGHKSVRRHCRSSLWSGCAGPDCDGFWVKPDPALPRFPDVELIISRQSKAANADTPTFRPQRSANRPSRACQEPVFHSYAKWSSKPKTLSSISFLDSFETQRYCGVLDDEVNAFVKVGFGWCSLHKHALVVLRVCFHEVTWRVAI
jgi:hypothetical protein